MDGSRSLRSSAVGSVGAVVIGPDYLDSFASNIVVGLRELGVESVVIDPNSVLNRVKVTSASGRYDATTRSWATAVRRVSWTSASIVEASLH